MKKLLFFLLLFLVSTASYSTIVQITNVGFTFSPATVTIHFGDSVNFTLAATHNALEVSQATWNANGNLANEVTPVDMTELIPGVYMIRLVGQRRSSVKLIKN